MFEYDDGQADPVVRTLISVSQELIRVRSHQFAFSPVYFDSMDVADMITCEVTTDVALF
jgi:hypothetical protein